MKKAILITTVLFTYNPLIFAKSYWILQQTEKKLSFSKPNHSTQNYTVPSITYEDEKGTPVDYGVPIYSEHIEFEYKKKSHNKANTYAFLKMALGKEAVYILYDLTEAKEICLFKYLPETYQFRFVIKNVENKSLFYPTVFNKIPHPYDGDCEL
jgi:hypothetical protein